MTLVDLETTTGYTWGPRPSEPTDCSSDMQVVMAAEDHELAHKPSGPAERVAVACIQSGSRRFMLRHELRPVLTREGSLWSCELDELRLMGYGYARREAIQTFMDDFAATYDGLIHERDSDLTLDAKELRDGIAGLVAAVERLEEPFAFGWHRPVAQRSFRVALVLDSITVSVESAL